MEERTVEEERPPAVTPAPPEKKTDEAAPEPKKLHIDRFFELDLRVARIEEVEKVPNADKLLKLQVDLGEEKRQIVAGVAEAYEAEALVGKRIIVVVNLKPARIRGVLSQGMLLAADLDGRPIVATFDEEVAPGTRVR